MSESILDDPWWGLNEDGGPPAKNLFFNPDQPMALEDFFQHNSVFVSGINGRRTHSDSYMTVVDFKALDKALQLLDAQYTPTAEDWKPALDYWLGNPNMQPPLRIVAFTIQTRYKMPKLETCIADLLIERGESLLDDTGVDVNVAHSFAQDILVEVARHYPDLKIPEPDQLTQHLDARNELSDLEKQFAAAGGRGVLYADRIDELRALVEKGFNDPCLDSTRFDVPFKAADAALHHAEESGPAHLVGDLQDLLRAAWERMSPQQRRAWLKDYAVINVFQNGYDEDREGLDIPEP